MSLQPATMSQAQGWRMERVFTAGSLLFWDGWASGWRGLF